MEEYDSRHPATQLQAGIFAVIAQLKQGPLPGEKQSVSIMRKVYALGTCAVRPLTVTLPPFFAHKLEVPPTYVVDAAIGTSSAHIHPRSPLAAKYFTTMEYDGLGETPDKRHLLYGVRFTNDHCYEWQPQHSHGENLVTYNEAERLINWLRNLPPPPQSTGGPLAIFPLS